MLGYWLVVTLATTPPQELWQQRYGTAAGCMAALAALVPPQTGVCILSKGVAPAQ